MKNNWIMRKLIPLTAAMIVLSLFTITAYAVPEDTDEPGTDLSDILIPVVTPVDIPDTPPDFPTGPETEIETDIGTPPPGPDGETTLDLTPETAPFPPIIFEPTPLTPPGNLNIVDDISGAQSGDKQFITVVTKSGHYFYIIIDRAGDRENVHFLNLVDEADLLAILESGSTSARPVTPATVETTPETPMTDAEPDPETEPEKSGIGGIIITVVLVAAIGGGAFYFFKIRKPKSHTAKNSGEAAENLDEFAFDDDEDFDSGYVDAIIGQPEDDADENGEENSSDEITEDIDDPVYAAMESPTPDSTMYEYGDPEYMDPFSFGVENVLPEETESGMSDSDSGNKRTENE
jgi:hypothetical protein